MVDVKITRGPAPTREERMELIYEYDQRIERLEAELAQAVRERQSAQMLTVKLDFIKIQRKHLDHIWFYAKVEGITERQYAEWKASRLSTGDFAKQSSGSTALESEGFAQAGQTRQAEY